MKENRTVARFFAGLLVISAITVGGMAPAQAKDTGWDLKSNTASSSKTFLSDTGWD